MSKFCEEEIVVRLHNINTRNKAFEELVGHFSSALYWQIRRIVVFHDDADDVLQNTFFKAWTSVDSFRGDSKLSTWLYKIALNESLTFLNRNKKNLCVESDVDGVAEMLESDPYFDGDEVQALLQEAISLLPHKQRVVFNMKYFEGMKYEDMSELLDTSVGALKASYHHAVKKIEDFFKSKE